MTELASSGSDQAGKPLVAHDATVEGGDTADPALDEPELHTLMRRAMIGRGNVDPDEVMAQLGNEEIEEPPLPDEGQATIFEEEDDPRGYSWEP